MQCMDCSLNFIDSIVLCFEGFMLTNEIFTFLKLKIKKRKKKQWSFEESLPQVAIHGVF